jgi:RNA polymerase sigma factor (sigma-70 family)
VEKTEATLWREFRNGDRDAFQSLLELFYAPLFEYGTKYQQDKDQLRDALHNLMISLWDRRQFLGDTDNLKLYLFKAIRNQIFREKSEPFSQASILNDENDYSFYAITYAENDIIEEETIRERASKIGLVMSHLTKRQQEVLHLKFYESLSNDQISEVLGVSRQAVANLVYHSLKAFRHNWETCFIQLFLLIIISISSLIYR